MWSRGRHAWGRRQWQVPVGPPSRKCYGKGVKHERSLFDDLDPDAEAAADARAEADVREGRLVSHHAMVRWLRSWRTGNRTAKPTIGE